MYAITTQLQMECNRLYDGQPWKGNTEASSVEWNTLNLLEGSNIGPLRGNNRSGQSSHRQRTITKNSGRDRYLLYSPEQRQEGLRQAGSKLVNTSKKVCRESQALMWRWTKRESGLLLFWGDRRWAGGKTRLRCD